MVFGLVAETAFVDLADDVRAGIVDTTKLNWIMPPLFSFLPPRFTFLPSLFVLPSSPFSRSWFPFSRSPYSLCVLS
jgi:hypothetical protein